MIVPDPITRPNGKLYRPRQVLGHPLVDGDECVAAILVTGTHDVARAQKLADECAAMWVDYGYVAIRPETGWWRDGFEMGHRAWIDDPVRGRAGVMFRQIVERSS